MRSTGTTIVWAPALVALAACNQLLGLDPAIQEPVVCERPGQVVTLPAVGVTYLDQADDRPHPDTDVVRIGAGQVGLVRFDVDEAEPRTLTVQLSPRPGASCGAACVTAQVEVTMLRSAWTEQASWTGRGDGSSWTTPGVGLDERFAAPTTSAVYTGNGPLDLVLALGTEDAPRASDGSISLLLVSAGPRDHASFVAAGVAGPAAQIVCRRTSTCGDAVVDPEEACDDGNPSSADGCTPDCEPTNCGNGVVDTGEVCDDGNTDVGDACPECQAPACGDRYVMRGSEECDDGNNLPGDGCDPNCQLES